MLVALTNEVSLVVSQAGHLVVLVALTNEVSHCLCLVVTSRTLSCVGGTDQ